MTLGSMCKSHNIPVNVCVACRGAREERERIIALLEALDAEYIQHGSCRLCEAIALIKGESE